MVKDNPIWIFMLTSGLIKDRFILRIYIPNSLLEREKVRQEVR